MQKKRQIASEIDMAFTSQKHEMSSCDFSLTTSGGMLCTSDGGSSSSLSFSSISVDDVDEQLSNIFVSDHRGDIALHRALADFSLQSIADPDSVPRLETRIRDMIYAWPDSIDVFNNDGMTPLHIACQEGASLPVILDLIRAKPHAASTATRNKRSMLPLHVACRYYSGPAATKLRIIQILLRAFPEAVQITTGAGELALHLCCQNHFCTVECLEVLVQAYPDALRIGTGSKRRQLHFTWLANEDIFIDLKERKSKTDVADSNRTSSDKVIRYLVRAYPESITVCDAKGELALHTAVRGYQSPETISFLMSVFPQAVEFADAKGRTPLHVSVANVGVMEPDRTTLNLLLRADPAATTVVDDHDNIPLHYAAKARKLDLIFQLIRINPFSLEALRSSSSTKAKNNDTVPNGNSWCSFEYCN